jgi:hypothetical protein
MAYNVPHVCDVAPRPKGPRGHVAERRAAAPRSPRRLPRRRCTYALLYEVTLSVIRTKPRGRFPPPRSNRHRICHYRQSAMRSKRAAVPSSSARDRTTVILLLSPGKGGILSKQIQLVRLDCGHRTRQPALTPNSHNAIRARGRKCL